MDIDEIFMEIGELGRQQYIFLALIFLMQFYMTFNVFKVNQKIIFLEFISNFSMFLSALLLTLPALVISWS